MAVHDDIVRNNVSTFEHTLKGDRGIGTCVAIKLPIVAVLMDGFLMAATGLDACTDADTNAVPALTTGRALTVSD